VSFLRPIRLARSVNTFRYSLHYITLHYITLHYITLHYITFIFIILIFIIIFPLCCKLVHTVLSVFLSLGYLGYLHYINGKPLTELDDSAFDNREAIEGYLSYLRVSNNLSLSNR